MIAQQENLRHKRGGQQSTVSENIYFEQVYVMRRLSSPTFSAEPDVEVVEAKKKVHLYLRLLLLWQVRRRYRYGIVLLFYPSACDLVLQQAFGHEVDCHLCKEGGT